MNHLLSENKVVRPKKVEYFKGEKEKQMQWNAVTRIRTWVTTATTQGPNH